MTEAIKQRGVHLHVHTYHSELDGAGPVEDMVKRAKEMGFKALAITDHGLCSGIPDFIEACYNEGIKPIPGCEIYMTKDMSFESSVPLTDEYSEKLYFKSKKKFNEMVKYIRRKARYQYKLPEYIDTVREYLQHAMMAIGSEEETFKILDEFLVKEFDSNNFHMVIMAKNDEGLSDLYQMNSHAHLHGMYKKPRVDLDYIKRENLGKNLIATTACIGSYFSQLILAGRYDDAKSHILECNEIFGHFYLEKQATTSLREQAIVNHWCDRMSKETGIPTILTNDVHYINKEDNKYHDVVVCCGTKGPGNKKRTINDPDRLQYDHEYWLKSTDEMMDAVPDMTSWERTLEIAELVNVSPMSDIKPQFPLYIMTKEEAASHDTVESLLRAEAWKGLFRVMTKYNFSNKQDYKKKYNQYAKQLEYELGVITKSGFADYFLIMKDAIQATNEAGYYTAPGRGSAAGSLVCWALGITDLDPVKEKLIFERFLNPERIGYPDIDTDFSDRGALFLFEYLGEKYGKDKVSKIGTMLTFAAKTAIKSVAEVMGHPDYKKLPDLIPGTPGVKLAEAYEESEELRQFAQSNPLIWEYSLKIEGSIRSYGAHAGGIIIAPSRIDRIVPLRRESTYGHPTSQFDMKWVEHLLVKFDILKLSTIDVIDEILEQVNLGEDFNINEINVNDPYVYETIFQTGDLSGVFQFESSGMRQTMVDMKPTRFEDLGVVAALYRPGPMDLIPTYINRKHGKEKVVYPFDSLEGPLKDTFGVWVAGMPTIKRAKSVKAYIQMLFIFI